MSSAVEAQSQLATPAAILRERILALALPARTWRLIWPSIKFLILFLWALIRRDETAQPYGTAQPDAERRGGGAPKILMEYLKTCGAGFVKVGQFLSTRYDLLPKAYCDQLLVLLDRADPADWNQIEAIIREDFRRDAERRRAESGGEDLRESGWDRIEHIDKKPIASASIAQVHAATLKTGEKVVLKVMRPGIRSDFGVDLWYLKKVAWLLDKLHILPPGQLTSIANEVIEFTREELDFRREARNTALMHRLLTTDGAHHSAPRIYSDLCGDAVITMERIEGISVKQMLDCVEKKDAHLLTKWYQDGIAPQSVAHTILVSMLMQTIHHRFFQMDPHPANILVTKGGKIVWVDFGMVGWLDERLVAQQLKLRKAIADEKIHEAYKSFLETLDVSALQELGDFERNVKSIIRDWLIAIKDDEAPVRDKSSGYMLMRLLQETRRAKLHVPTQSVRLYRAIITADTLMLRLDPKIDSLGILRDFVDTEARRQLETMWKENLFRSTINALAHAILHMPQAAAKLLERVENLDELFRPPRSEFAWVKRGFLTTLRFFELLIFLSLMLILYYLFQRVIPVQIPPSLLKNPLLGRLFDLIQTYGWFVLAALILIWLFARRLVKRIEKS